MDARVKDGLRAAADTSLSLAKRHRIQEKALDLWVRSDPQEVRRWVEYHPVNLQRLAGMTVEPFHEAAFEDALAHPQTLWLAPRGSGKSTSLGVFFPAWLAIARPEHMRPDVRLFPDAPRPIGPGNIRIALTSNSQDRAKSMHRQVWNIYAHRRVREVFGPLIGQPWRDANANTRYREQYPDKAGIREDTFTCLGLGSKIAGGHYDAAVCDDWVTEDNARTELRRERLETFWNQTVKPTHEPWARTIVCGTRYHTHDWYATIARRAEAGVFANVRRTPALVAKDGGPPDYSTPESLVSYWDEAYSVRKLLDIRWEIGSLAFETQYQNSTDEMLGDFFAQEHVENLAKWSEVPSKDKAKAKTVIALDPAIKGGPRNDYSVFTIVSLVAPYFYVRRVVRGQWTNRELLYIAGLLTRQYRPFKVGVEVVGGTEWLVSDLRRKLNVPVQGLNPVQYRGKDKVGRAAEARVRCEQGRVFIEDPTGNPDCGTDRLIYEMKAFPNASQQPGMDDAVDSFVWAIILLTLSRTRLGRARR